MPHCIVRGYYSSCFENSHFETGHCYELQRFDLILGTLDLYNFVICQPKSTIEVEGIEKHGFTKSKVLKYPTLEVRLASRIFGNGAYIFT